MKKAFIVNLNASNADAIKILDFLNFVCKKDEYHTLFTTTEYKGHATKLAKMLSEEYDTIIAVGGDGTINEVFNGINPKKNVLGIIPVGNGNDLYKSINKEEYMDYGVVNGYRFLNIASVGFDAEVADLANKYKEKGNVKNAYKRAILKKIFNYDPINISINGADEELVTILAICNGKYYGNGIKISPRSKIDDGLFDICKANALNVSERLALLQKLKNGTHINDKRIKQTTVTNLQINSTNDLICNIDGEIIKDKTLNFKIMPRGIRLYNDIYIENNVNKLLKKR